MRAKRWKILFFVAGILIFACMIYTIGLDTIWENLQKTDIWFFPVLGVWLVVYIINALAWYSIICDKSVAKKNLPSFRKIVKVTISGYAINYITPVVALGGEPYRIMEVQDELGGRKATSAVLSYSMMHILSHIVFWMASIILILTLFQPALGIRIGCAVVFIIFGFFLYMIFKGYRKGLIVKLFRILGKIPLVKKPAKKFLDNKLSILQNIDQNIIALYTQRKATFYLALSLEFLARVISCFELLFIGRSIGMGIGIIDSIVLYAGSTLFSNILFFSPMQLGTREGGLALTLSIMGYAASSGIYIGVIMRIRELMWIGLGLLLMRIKK